MSLYRPMHMCLLLSPWDTLFRSRVVLQSVTRNSISTPVFVHPIHCLSELVADPTCASVLDHPNVVAQTHHWALLSPYPRHNACTIRDHQFWEVVASSLAHQVPVIPGKYTTLIPDKSCACKLSNSRPNGQIWQHPLSQHWVFHRPLTQASNSAFDLFLHWVHTIDSLIIAAPRHLWFLVEVYACIAVSAASIRRMPRIDLVRKCQHNAYSLLDGKKFWL